MLALLLHIKYLENKIVFKLLLSFAFSFFLVCDTNFLWGLKKCPECFGNDKCHFFRNKEVKLTSLSYFFSLFNPRITKSVFFGTLNGSELVVFKIKSRKRRKHDIQSDLLKLKERHILHEVEEERQTQSNVILCPGFRDLKFLFEGINKTIAKGYLWFDIDISLEPLLLMYFHSFNGMPIPKYLGACGDIIIEDYKGLPLTDFLTSSFERRVFLAVKLLKLAHKFTFEIPEYRFYFTDMSHYNLAVDSYGNVTLVDLDSVIIFDKQSSQAKISNTVHRSKIFSGFDYAFSPGDICHHDISDHNYFSVCVDLFFKQKDGLLNDIPKYITARYPELISLLEKCRNPQFNSNRIKEGEKLLFYLENIIQNYTWVLDS